MLDLVGRPGGPLADASLWHLEVIESLALSSSTLRLVLTAPDLDDLRFMPGQDLMLRVPISDMKIVNRRYTIRRFDRTLPAVFLDVSTHGAGPGTDWVRGAQVGSRIDAIGPRGKVTAREDADWHLFIGDETGLPGSLAMIEGLEPSSTVTALLEIDSPADEQEPDASPGPQLAVRWLHRHGKSAPGDPSLMLEGLTGVELPSGHGHAYVAAEARVVRTIRSVLIERGFDPTQISAKAYWRLGLPNAEHGEPTGDD
jgi:NADPH-dependent ferric siderophore reductase